MIISIVSIFWVFTHHWSLFFLSCDHARKRHIISRQCQASGKGDQKLYWSTHLKLKDWKKLRAGATSLPEENWEIFDCILKYSYILTFKEALEIEQKLSQCSETEALKSFLIVF